MYKTNSRFLQDSMRLAAGRLGKAKGAAKKKRNKTALKDPTVLEALKASAEHILKKWAKQRLRGAKAPRRILPSLARD